MGEYAVFVWPCYAATVVLLTALGFLSWKRKIDDEKKLAELQTRFNNLNKQE